MYPHSPFLVASVMSVDSEHVLGMVYTAASVVGNSSVPFEGYIASGWEYMTSNYSRFTIATCFSVILHEVCLCLISLVGKGVSWNLPSDSIMPFFHLCIGLCFP